MYVQAHPMWWLTQSLTTSQGWCIRPLYLLGALCHRIPLVHGRVCVESCIYPQESPSSLPTEGGRCSSPNGNAPPKLSTGRDSPATLGSDIVKWDLISQYGPYLRHPGLVLMLYKEDNAIWMRCPRIPPAHMNNDKQQENMSVLDYKSERWTKECTNTSKTIKFAKCCHRFSCKHVFSRARIHFFMRESTSSR